MPAVVQFECVVAERERGTLRSRVPTAVSPTAPAIAGAVLLGMQQPITVLALGSSVSAIVNLTVITALRAQYQNDSA